MISKFYRYQENKLRQRIALGVLGSLAIIILIVVFGFKMLINFSLLLDNLNKGSDKASDNQQSALLLPPILDWSTEATNSAEISVKGTGSLGNTIVLYNNDSEIFTGTVDDSGNFSANIKLKPGINKLTAILKDDKENKSNYSNTISITLNQDKPNLVISTPDQESIDYASDNPNYQIKGKTDQDDTLTINGHIVIVNSDGSFSYNIKLNDGENTFTIIATNFAGNITSETRIIKYSR